MTQVKSAIIIPEPQGTSQISFHAISSLEGWNFALFPEPNERQTVSGRKEKEPTVPLQIAR